MIEYIARARHKNGLEDLKKARWWLDRRIAREENGVDENGVTILLEDAEEAEWLKESVQLKEGVGLRLPVGNVLDDEPGSSDAGGEWRELDDHLAAMGVRRTFNEERATHEFYEPSSKGWRPFALITNQDLRSRSTSNAVERLTRIRAGMPVDQANVVVG